MEKKIFVPKRRAPYLLQEEIIKKKSIDELTGKIKENNRIFESSDVFLHNEKENLSKSKNEKLGDVELNYYEEISKLSGIQKKIAYYLFQLCKNRKDTTTGPITIETLCATMNTTKKTIKKIMQRMVEKKIVYRLKGKSGNGGFSIFRLDNKFIDVLRLQIEIEKNQITNSDYFKENSNSNNNENYKNLRNNSLPAEWLEIDFSVLEEIGFGLPQIFQIYNKQVTTARVVQDSINHFAFSLKNKTNTLNKYSNKLATIMSVLQKGGAWVEKDYQSPQEIAQKNLSEQKHLARERMKKMADEAFNLAFDTWQDSLSKAQIDELTQKRGREDITPARVKLHSHFRENIWPGMKHEYLVESE